MNTRYTAAAAPWWARLLTLTLLWGWGGCGAEEGEESSQAEASQMASLAGWSGVGPLVTENDGRSAAVIVRRRIDGDIYQYSVVVPVGPGAADRVRLHRVVRERAPFLPVPTSQAVMLLHGDFSTFQTNFALAPVAGGVSPRHALAVFLAERGVDVWGLDRRWTLLPADTTDFSSLRDQGYALALRDTEWALRAAQLLRGLGGDGWGKLTLGGFSRGAHLAYAFAGADALRPPAQRLVKALVPLDMYYKVPPEAEASRLVACAGARDAAALIAAGVYESETSFFALVGELARSAPADASPIAPAKTNLQYFLGLTTKTYTFFNPTPWYHLNAGTFVGTAPTGLRFSPLGLAEAWFAGATSFQSVAEDADGGAIWCGEGTQPIPDNLAKIQVPLLYLGAAGGFGELGRYTTTLVGSRDVSARVIRRLPRGSELEDFGHADLLFAADAPALVWEPMARWIKAR